MLTPAGEKALRTGKMGKRKATPEELLCLEIHSRCPDIKNCQEVMVEAMMLADGDVEIALECVRDGEFELVPNKKSFH